MTIASTGPSGFHLKPLVAVFALAVIIAGALAIVQVAGTDSPPTTPAPAGAPAPVEVSAETVERYTGPSGLAQALAEGKFDGGLTSAHAQPFVGGTPAPEIVVIEGQGGLHDALIEGKLTMDNPGVRYAASPGTAEAASTGLRAAFDAGRLDEGVDGGFAMAPSPPAVGAPTVSGGHQE